MSDIIGYSIIVIVSAFSLWVVYRGERAIIENEDDDDPICKF